MEADEILKKMAKGLYRCISFKLDHFSDVDAHTSCRVYIEGGKWHSAPTFEMALKSLRTSGQSQIEERQEVGDEFIKTGLGHDACHKQDNPGKNPGNKRGKRGTVYRTPALNPVAKPGEKRKGEVRLP